MMREARPPFRHPDPPFTDIEGSTKLLHELGAAAYRLSAQVGDTYWMPIIVCRLGGALVVGGKPLIAATVLSAGEALLEESGSSSSWMIEMNGERRAQIEAQLDAETFAAAWEATRGLTADEAVALALHPHD